jgi:hypothetical protein
VVDDGLICERLIMGSSNYVVCQKKSHNILAQFLKSFPLLLVAVVVLEVLNFLLVEAAVRSQSNFCKLPVHYNSLLLLSSR